jgi:UTP--glucose-1-phosphate uridylyltransferase
VRQKELNGLGDAISYARHHVGNEPFAVLLGDTIVNSVIPVTRQLIDIYEQYHGTVVAVETVDADKVNRYGIVGGKKLSEQVMELDAMIEKPAIDKAPSNLAIAGRYILTPEIFDAIKNTPRGKGNEIQLTDAMNLLMRSERVYAYTMEGKRYDIGNKLDFLKTTVEFALRRKEFAQPFLQFLKEVVAETEANK